MVTADEVRGRLAFLDIGPEDERLLREAHPRIKAYGNAVAERLYQYLLEHEDTRRLLDKPGLIGHLKKLQEKYFDELTTGVYDAAYFENRLRVGVAHHKAGIGPQWYLGAYYRYLNIIGEVLRSEYANDRDRVFNTMFSLTKVVYLDMSLAIDAYMATEHGALEKANDDLHRLQAARRELVRMIVHDLQNPITGIMAFLQHLEGSGKLSESEREAHAEALRRCADLSGMVMNVLQVTRADDGELQTYIEDIDVSDLARDAAAGFTLAAKQNGRAIVLDADKPAPTRTDQTLVRRMIENLLRNALRHTPVGTTVTLRTQVRDGKARATVSDDGPGIPREAQAMLFQRFSASALREAGLRVDSGLGLPYCAVAARAVGATISVESDGSHGTAFHIDFP